MYSAKLQTIRLLTGLSLINNERVAGYNKALELLHSDADTGLQNVNLQLLLSNFLRDSKIFSSTLSNIVLIEGGKMPYGTKVDQQLYQMARSLKELFTGLSRQSILSLCEACENILQKAYDTVLSESRLAIDPRDIVLRQKKELQKAQEFVQSLNKELSVVQKDKNLATVYQLHANDTVLAYQSKIGG